MFQKIRHSRAGFTLVELLVGMTIFSIAMTSIYLLLTSTMKSVAYSRNEIIVSNLLREKMELMRNLRDSNVTKNAVWNAWKVWNDGASSVFSDGVYTVENDFTNTSTTFDENGKIKKSPVKIAKIAEISDNGDFDNSVDNQEKLKKRFDASQLCFDDKKRYVRCESGSMDTTNFASYVKITQMAYKDKGGNMVKIEKDNEGEKNPQWFIIDARVIVRDANMYREYDAKTALTEWQQ